MLDVAARVPATVDALDGLPKLFIGGLAVHLRVLHEIEAQAVEVAQSVGFGLENDRLPVHLAAAVAGGHELVFEVTEAIDDLLDGGVASYMVSRLLKE